MATHHVRLVVMMLHKRRYSCYKKFTVLYFFMYCRLFWNLNLR